MAELVRNDAMERCMLLSSMNGCRGAIREHLRPNINPLPAFVHAVSNRLRV